MSFSRISQTSLQKATQAKQNIEPASLKASRKENIWAEFGVTPLLFSTTPQLAAIPKIQTKLKIGKPNDKYEQEADKIAEQVMQMPASQVQRQINSEDDNNIVRDKFRTGQPQSLIQCRRIGNGQTVQINDAAQSKDVFTQSPTTVNPGVAKRIQNLRDKGQPLSTANRDFFESRFGHDFSKVKVHSESETTRAISARAYTVGSDIVFYPGEYSPNSYEGKKLIAHELVHVLQQRSLSAFEQKLIQKQDGRDSGPIENSSYDEARDHVRTFYSRQQIIVQTLARMRDQALQLFTSYSSETMNPAEPELLDLMEAALAFVPLASAMGQTLRVLRNQAGFVTQPLMDSFTSLAAAATTQSSEARGLFTGDDESVIREQFRAQTIQSLADIEVSTLSHWWQEEDVVIRELRSHRYDPNEVDLLAQVQASLGDIPTASDLETEARLVRDQFELQLYRRFYFGSSGRATIDSYIDEFTDSRHSSRERPTTLHLENVPGAVRRRIDDLNGWETVLEGWTPSGGITTSRAMGRSVSLPGRPSQGEVDRMRHELLIPDLADRVLQTFRLLFDPLNPASSLMMHSELRRMIDAAGVVVDPTRRVLETRDGIHEPLIFQRALLALNASEIELLAIVRIISSGPVMLRHRSPGGTPYVDARR